MSEHCEVECPYCGHTIKLGSDNFQVPREYERVCSQCDKAYRYTLRFIAETSKIDLCEKEGHLFNKSELLSRGVIQEHYISICERCGVSARFCVPKTKE